MPSPVVIEVRVIRDGAEYKAMAVLPDDAIEFGAHKLAINQTAFDRTADLLRKAAQMAYLGISSDLVFTEVERGRK